MRDSKLTHWTERQVSDCLTLNGQRREQTGREVIEIYSICTGEGVGSNHLHLNKVRKTPFYKSFFTMSAQCQSSCMSVLIPAQIVVGVCVRVQRRLVWWTKSKQNISTVRGSVGVALKELPVVAMTGASTASFPKALWSHGRHFESHWKRGNLSTGAAFPAPLCLFDACCLCSQGLNGDVIWQGQGHWILPHVEYLLYLRSATWSHKSTHWTNFFLLVAMLRPTENLQH